MKIIGKKFVFELFIIYICRIKFKFMKSIFENVFIHAVEQGELKADILEEIEHNLEAHTRVINCMDMQIKKLEEKKDAVIADITCLNEQREIIEGSL